MNMISDTIKYIGVDDLDIDLFESQYVVPEGMSYNSYLIDDEKIAILDTADRRKGEAWKANLKAALNGRQPDYLVAHHMEPDHSALIAWMLETYPGLQLVCSAQAAKMLSNFFEGFNFEGRVIIVKEGDTLKLGQHTLQFISAAMVHWPEVIMSYDCFDKVLFSADGFGKFGALVNETDDWACEARRYYLFRPSVRCTVLCSKVNHWLLPSSYTTHGASTSPRARAYSSPMPAFTAERLQLPSVWVRYSARKGPRKWW